MNIQIAYEEAYKLAMCLAPACKRIEIVGSCKRGDKDEVHDIEILCILSGEKPRPEFGMKPKEVPTTMLDMFIKAMKAENILRDPARKANGEKYKKFAIVKHSQVNEFCLDLFIVTPETWGIQNVIRTGPSLFSHSFVTNKGITFYDDKTYRHYEGLLPLQYRYVRGETKIMQGDSVLELPEEKDALALLGHGWIEPKDRRNYIKTAQPAGAR